MFFKSKKVLGLDIGTSAVKISEMDVSRKGVTLLNFAMDKLPVTAVTGGEINDPDAVAIKIRNIIAGMRTKRTMVSTGIWGGAVIVKKMSLPRMDTNLIGEQIRWEAEQYIPFDINEINLEYHVLNRGRSAETMDIIIVGAKRDLVFKYAEAIDLAGLQCAVVDVSGFALANAFKVNYPPVMGEVVALLNVGAGVTNFVVLDSGEAIFCRDIPVGGINYTVDIQKQMEVSYEEAEALKISYSNGQATPPEVASIVQATHEMFIDELRRTFDFYNATGNDQNIKRFFITGGGSQVPAIKDAISNGLSTPIETFNPFLTIGYNSGTLSAQFVSQIAPFAATAIGLGMREVD